MASPQTENGFIKIANDLWNELLKCNFTKRQQNIILLIWRLSYGCGQKDCFISKYNIFELCGLDKSDIKKELKYLSMCKVIFWDEQNMVFSINKDYDIWRISPIKNWDDEKFKEAIAENLSRKKVGKIPTDENKEVGKIPTNTDKRVGILPTYKLVKYQPLQPATPTAPTDASAVNTLLNTINNKDKEEEEEKPNPFLFFEQNGFGTISAFINDEFSYWIDGGYFEEPELILIEGMKEALKANTRNLKYVFKCLGDWRTKKLKTLKDVQASNKQYEANKQVRTNKKPVRTENTPDWFEDTPEAYKPKEDKPKEDAEAKKRAMAEKLKAFNKGG